MAAERSICLIDKLLLDEVGAEARASPRRRKNRNFHDGDEHPGQRLLNAIEPGSYVAPHRHLDPHKDETMLVVRGRLGLVLFNDVGKATSALVLGSDGDALGVDIPSGSWHTVLALDSGTVFLEAKAGPYRPLTPAERAAWAPPENDTAAPAYGERLRSLFPR